MELLAIDHIQIAIPAGCEEQARSFYKELLGFEEVSKPSALRVRGGLWLAAGSIRLHLGVDRLFTAAQKAHPAFLVRGLCAFEDNLTKAGYRVERDVQLETFDRLHVFDPFGNRIELMERRLTQPI